MKLTYFAFEFQKIRLIREQNSVKGIQEIETSAKSIKSVLNPLRI